MANYFKMRRLGDTEAAARIIVAVTDPTGKDTAKLAAHLKRSNLRVVEVEKARISFARRLTTPFALLLMLSIILVSPLRYIVTGKWHYRRARLHSWLASLGLI